MPNISPSLKELAAAIVDKSPDAVQIIVGKGDDRQLTLTCVWTKEYGFEVSSEVAEFVKEYPATRYEPAEQLWRYNVGKSYSGRSVRGIEGVAYYDGFNIDRWELLNER